MTIDRTTLDTLRQIAAAKAGAMSHHEKVAYLRSRGWRPERGNRWQARNGVVASLANAVRLQALARPLGPHLAPMCVAGPCQSTSGEPRHTGRSAWQTC